MSSACLIVLYACIFEAQGLRLLQDLDDVMKQPEIKIRPLERFLQDVDAHFQSKGRRFPLTLQSIQDSLNHEQYYTTNYRRLQNVGKKMLHGEHVTIVTLGGSISAGQAGCLSGEDDGPWPELLQRYLQDEVSPNITVINRAMGGSTSMETMQHWAAWQEDFTNADLVIDEHNFNDHYEHPEGRGGYNRVEEAAAEVVYSVLNSPKKPAFVYMDTSGIGSQQAMEAQINATAHESSCHFAVAANFKVPLIWYPKAVKGSGSIYIDRNPDFEAHGHPYCFPFHPIMATLLYSMLHTQMSDHVKLQDEPHIPELHDATLDCSIHPEFTAFAELGKNNFPLMSSDGWDFGYDVPSKPGWFSKDDNLQHDIVFQVPVKHRVMIQFLQTYENIGTALCQLKDHDGSVVASETFNGLWNQHVSQYKTGILTLDRELPTATKYDLQCRSDGRKFKIASIVSC